MKKQKVHILLNKKKQMKYEYKIVYGDSTKTMEVFLNGIGQDGWELCHWERYINGSTFIFKRKI